VEVVAYVIWGNIQVQGPGGNVMESYRWHAQAWDEIYGGHVDVHRSSWHMRSLVNSVVCFWV
jgi:hypothetical protein